MKEKISPGEQYERRRHMLGWTHAQAGAVLGRSERTMYRYAVDATRMPRGLRRLMHALCYLRFTMERRKFDQIVRAIMKD